MILLNNRELFTNAINKAKKVKPRVWPGNTFGIYFVEGESQDYRVQFGKVNGQPAASCNCEAHLGPKKLTSEQRLAWKPKPCYHIPSSATSHHIQIGIRRQVKAAQTPSVSNWIVSPEKEAA